MQLCSSEVATVQQLSTSRIVNSVYFSHPRATTVARVSSILKLKIQYHVYYLYNLYNYAGLHRQWLSVASKFAFEIPYFSVMEGLWGGHLPTPAFSHGTKILSAWPVSLSSEAPYQRFGVIWSMYYWPPLSGPALRNKKESSRENFAKGQAYNITFLSWKTGWALHVLQSFTNSASWCSSLIIFADTLVSFNKNANPEVGKRNQAEQVQTHLVPTSIMFHQGYPAAWQCRLIWNRAQGGRATIWVIWLLHRIEPTVLGLFQILSTKSCFCLHQTSQHQGHLGPTASISAKVSKPQTHQAIVDPFERPVLVSSSDHSTASMFLFARTWSSSKLSSHSKQMQGGNRQLRNVTMFHLCLQRKGYVDTSLWSLSTEV